MKQRISTKDKIKRGTYRPSNDVEAKINKPLREIPDPFFPLTPQQLIYFKVTCGWLVNNEALKPLFIPQITRYAVLLDMYMRTKNILDDSGPVQVYDNGTSNISGAMNAVDRIEKQLSSIEGKFGFDLKSYGTLKMTDAEDEDTAKDFE